ncbi:MAG TPA: hypothetical protein IAD11_04620 [Candidatus Stercorousia faecigallinarum]|nr:hypothetical protein [Candidatus Stercorousia faecigallinarum]
MLNGVFQRPYLNKDGRNLVKKKQDEEKNASSAAQREEQANQNARSKGLQYVEQKKPSYTPAYQQQNNGEQVDWRQMRSQIQSQAQNRNLHTVPQTTAQTQEITPTKTLSGRSTVINIAQILKDFRNTAAAIGTPDDLKEEVNGYLSLIEAQVQKDNPNTKLVKSNLKNASSILDTYISQTLNKDSKVVENWVDALFLQQIDFKYNENEINPQFLVKFPEGSTQQEEKADNKTAVQETVTEPVQKEIETNAKVVSLIPQDKELKSLFIQSKKLAYANKPEKAIETFQKALQRADEVGDTETKSKIYYEVGRIYDDHDYYAHALTSYNQSLQNTTDNNVKTKAHYSMAQIYDDVNQIEPALDHYFNSISYAGEAENLAAQSTSLTKMGNIFTDMYEDEAMDYYSVAEDLALQTDNARIKGFVSSSRGNSYEKFGEPQQALKFYSKAVKHYADARAPLKVAQNYSKAADIMVEHSNVSKAKGLLTKAQNYARQTDDVNLMNEIREKLSSLELLG